jgi:hypothetical protein
MYLSLSFNNYIFSSFIIIITSVLKKIGDKKELDIKFDDFLTNLIFQFIKKKEKKQIKQNKSEPLLKKNGKRV